MKRLRLCVLVLVMTLLLAAPVLAAPEGQGSGEIHFGPYTLGAGSRATGDLVVLGGPAMLREDSEFDGDLTVFGALKVDEGATVDGQVVVMGEADVAGEIVGDVFAAGSLVLRETAYVNGDVTSAGTIEQDPGAVIVGELLPFAEGGGFRWEAPVTVPFAMPRTWERSFQIDQTPRWVHFLWSIVRGFVSVVMLGLLALVIASLWPAQTERIGRVIEEAPLTAFGTGLLSLLVATVVAVLLTLTICLSPFAILGLIVVGIGVLLGWVALGLVLARRVLVGAFNQPSPRPAVAAMLGTALITLVLALSRVFGVLHTLLLLFLVPPAVGAVVLTRFGSMPYATRGPSETPPPPAPRVTEPPRPGARSPKREEAELPGEAMTTLSGSEGNASPPERDEDAEAA